MTTCDCPCCARDRALRQLAVDASKSFTSVDRGSYLDTGNGLHAWVAYRRTRQVNAPLPAWVLDYLDRVYDRLKAKGGTASAKQIAAALELHTRGGGRTARDRAITRRQHVAIFDMVGSESWRAHGKTFRQINLAQREVIFATVAEHVGLTVERVRAIAYEMAPAKIRAAKKSR